MPDAAPPPFAGIFWERVFVRLCTAATGCPAEAFRERLLADPDAWRGPLQHLGLSAWPAQVFPQESLFRDWAAQERRRQEKQMAETAEVQGILADAGAPSVLLKGHRTCALYPVPEMRPVTDIDVLIAPEMLRPATAALQRAGFVPCTAAPPRFNFEWTFRRGDTILDLHLDLLPRWRIPWNGAEAMLHDLDRPALHAWHALAHFAQHKGFVKPVQEVDLLLFDRSGHFAQVPAPLRRALQLWRYRKLLFWDRVSVPRHGLFRCYDAANWAPYNRFWRLRHALIGLAVSTRRRGWFAQLCGVRL